MSSIEIPKEIEKIRTVDGLTGIPNQPIRPAVINRGNKFGMIATTTILGVLNKIAIMIDIRTIASIKLNTRLLIKNFVLLRNIMLAPVY